ncbi:MAG: type I-C CRISPR-associated protein Cas8c/Csd1 [Pirellulales bacterium]|nr:type I-C CRISPR-associated protein Cas8c/Csd1 [Pirellulales bacterium]
MILAALSRRYRQVAADSSSGITPIGHRRQRVSFCLTLGQDGSLLRIDDVRIKDGAKSTPVVLTVPGLPKPPGSGINPGFLCDNAAYLVGYKADDRHPKRTAAAFAAFRNSHLLVEEEIGDPAFFGRLSVFGELEARIGSLASWHERARG